MDVDATGHQDAAGGIVDLGVVSGLQVPADGADAAVLDQDVGDDVFRSRYDAAVLDQCGHRFLHFVHYAVNHN